MVKITENKKASIWQIESKEYEVWMKLAGVDGKQLEPSDEDFGVWAWSAYTYPRALEIYFEINSGKRKISPMLEVE